VSFTDTQESCQGRWRCTGSRLCLLCIGCNCRLYL